MKLQQPVMLTIVMALSVAVAPPALAAHDARSEANSVECFSADFKGRPPFKRMHTCPQPDETAIFARLESDETISERPVRKLKVGQKPPYRPAPDRNE